MLGKENLQIHKNAVHLGQMDHKCNVCEKAFGWKTALKKHVDKVHLGIANHECDYCEKTFGLGRISGSTLITFTLELQSKSAKFAAGN